MLVGEEEVRDHSSESRSTYSYVYEVSRLFDYATDNTCVRMQFTSTLLDDANGHIGITPADHGLYPEQYATKQAHGMSFIQEVARGHQIQFCWAYRYGYEDQHLGFAPSCSIFSKSSGERSSKFGESNHVLPGWIALATFSV
jgi:hypothetical protein